MLRVLLVDDEPFIIQGLRVLIDWEQEGFVIAGTASNGQEAYEFLKKETVDLILADIQMPVMNGLKLQETIQRENLSDAYCVILSGYADFNYAQRAIKNKCLDYILKPVDREMLLKLLNRVRAMRDEEERVLRNNRRMEQAYFARQLIALIKGKFDNSNLEYVQSHMKCREGVRYVEIQMAECDADEDITDKEMREFQRMLYDGCVSYLKEHSSNCVFDVSADEKIYDVGLILFVYMAQEADLEEKDYLKELLDYLNDNLPRRVLMLVGKQVPDISYIARSYGNACMLRSFQGFRSRKEIYYYEEEVHVSSDGMVLCKQILDNLLKVVEQNNHIQIRAAVDQFYKEMGQRGIYGESMNLNINYLLFQLIHLASEQDDEVNQEEILRLISESSFDAGTIRGGKSHLTRFACEYGDYLSQLRKNVSRGVPGMVEKEIKEHYADNITLKSLSEKYYVNSAYLGQLFRKKYGQSFKDYLNNYRMERAADLLIHTDKKIFQIAEEVGYHDLDYFVNRFIQVKGCTPAKFRRQMQQGG